MKDEIKRLRMAVIGCGAIGRLHAEAILRSERAELVATCDVEPARAEAVTRGTEARAYAGVKELLKAETLDAVSIATPDHLHVEPTIQALEAGCHVFCEKPLAMTLDEARAMTETATRCGKHLAVDYNRRFGFGYRKAEELVAEGRIGRVTHAFLRVTDGIPWFVAGRGPYALLTSLLTHHIDLLRWFCGEVESVHARLAEPNAEEGQFRETLLSLRFAGGIVGTLVGGWRAGQSRTIELMELGGTGGYLQVDDVQRGVQLYGLDADRFETFRPNYFRGDDTAFYDSLAVHLESFTARIGNGEAPLVTGQDGVRGLEIVQAAIESHLTGQTVAT